MTKKRPEQKPVPRPEPITESIDWSEKGRPAPITDTHKRPKPKD